MSQSSISVLIVNDQEDVAHLWQRLIQHTPGMTCPGVAHDGEEAVLMTRQLRPDVVLMDIMMPIVDGLEATRTIVNDLPDTVIIVFSAHTGMSEEAFAAGADEFILMPITPDKLVSTIKRIYEASAKRA